MSGDPNQIGPRSAERAWMDGAILNYFVESRRAITRQ